MVGKAVVRQLERLAQAQAAVVLVSLCQQHLPRHQEPRCPARQPLPGVRYWDIIQLFIHYSRRMLFSDAQICPMQQKFIQC